MRFAFLLIFLPYSVFAFINPLTPREIERQLDYKLIPDHYSIEEVRNKNVGGTYYDRLVYYKAMNGAVVYRKGWVTRGVGQHSSVVFYQRANGWNTFQIAHSGSFSRGGTHYRKAIFYKNKSGRNLAILSQAGGFTFYQNGVFKNIAATRGGRYFNGVLRQTSSLKFEELIQEWEGLFLY